MSVQLPELVTVARCLDEASGVLKQIASNAQGSMGEVQTAANKVEDAHKKMNSGLKDVVTGFSGVATSAFALYNAYDRVQDMEVSVDKANLAVKVSANSLEDAQTKLNVAVEKYGPDSAQAVSAAKDLQLAQERYQVATERAEMVQGNLNETMVSSALSVMPIAITMITSVSTAISGMSAATGALSGAMTFLSANPIVLVIAAVAALVVGLIWAYNNVKPFHDAVNQLGEALSNALKPAIDAVMNALTWLWNNVISPLIGIFKTLWDTITNNPILAVLFGPITTITFLITHWAEVTQVLGQVWNTICSGLRTVWDSTAGFIINSLTTFVSSIQSIFNFLFGWLVGGSLWTTLCNSLSSVWTNALQGILNFAQTITSGLMGAFQGLSSGLSGVWNTIVGGAQSAVSSIGTALSNIGSSVNSAWNSLQSLASNAVSTVSSTISNAVSTVSNAVLSLINPTVTPTVTTTTATSPAVVVNTTSTTSPISSIIAGGGGTTKGTIQVMQEGGYGVVDRPTLFLAGEHEPEAYSFRPASKGSEPVERSLTINFSPNIQSGPVYGVRGVRELADLLYEEFNKRIRNELKSRTLYLER